MAPEPATKLTCGPGTRRDGDLCIAESKPAIVCGPGTVLRESTCLPTAGMRCADGTSAHDGFCVPDVTQSDLRAHRLDLRHDDTDYYVQTPLHIFNDQNQPTLFTVFGVNRDKSPNQQPVELKLTRPNVGKIELVGKAMGVGGLEYNFIPSGVPSAAGKFRIQISSADGRDKPLGMSPELELANPASLLSYEECRGPEDTVALHGDKQDFIFSDSVVLKGAAVTAQFKPNELTVYLKIRDAENNFTMIFRPGSRPFGEGVYRHAERAPLASKGRPGLEISGRGHGCNAIDGTFQIVNMQASGERIDSITMTFEQHCDGKALALRGCLHLKNQQKP